MKNKQSNFLSQLIEKKLYNGRIAIYTRINNFKCGEIDFKTATFYCVHRSAKNLMRMFNGLGLNEALLQTLKELGIKFIEIPYCGETLKTTVNKWVLRGIPSRYASDKVDKQIILKLDEITLNTTDKNLKTNNDRQLFLFSGAQ